MVGILNPRDLPPKTGTQSGTSKWILFRPFIIQLIASMTMLISAMMPLRGAFAMATSAVKIPLKISCTPFHALSQSPVKTPRIKSIIPSKTAFMESQTDFTVAKKKFKISPKIPNDSDQSVVNTPCKKSSTRWRMACISSPFVAISATSPTMAAMSSTIGFAIMKFMAVISAGITVPVIKLMAPAIPEIIPAIGEIAAIRPPTIRIVFFTPSSRFENQSIAF